MAAEQPCQNLNPLLVVLSGPSGVGKDAVLTRMIELKRPYHFTVTATTRPKRPQERDGTDYFFVTKQTFEQMIRDGDLLEWAEVYSNYYGVPRSQVVEALQRGQDVIIKADVQGAATIKGVAPEALSIFLAPPSKSELERRLRERMTESEDTLKHRLETAGREMEEASSFDYVVVNHKNYLDEAVAEIERIIYKERCRVPTRRAAL
jgi:guanylate kinase